jgi:hypothetical protein
MWGFRLTILALLCWVDAAVSGAAGQDGLAHERLAIAHYLTEAFECGPEWVRTEYEGDEALGKSTHIYLGDATRFFVFTDMSLKTGREEEGAAPLSEGFEWATVQYSEVGTVRAEGPTVALVCAVGDCIKTRRGTPGDMPNFWELAPDIDFELCDAGTASTVAEALQRLVDLAASEPPNALDVLGLTLVTSEQGIVVGRIAEGSPAAESRVLSPGDLVLAVNGIAVGSIAAMETALLMAPTPYVEITFESSDGATQSALLDLLAALSAQDFDDGSTPKALPAFEN